MQTLVSIESSISNWLNQSQRKRGLSTKQYDVNLQEVSLKISSKQQGMSIISQMYENKISRRDHR